MACFRAREPQVNFDRMAGARRPVPSGLPIDAVLADLGAALAAHPAAVLQAPPGAGKTTIVPLALRDAPWLGGRRLVILEPRRLAARVAARRMALLLGEETGATVGYRTRLDTRVGPSTRIEVVTEGVLTRMLQHDPTLDGYGLVVFDEFHERGIHGDTGLALTLHTQRLVRPDLRILVMSATLDGAKVARLLSEAPIVASAGRQFPVETRYLPTPRDGRIETGVASAVRLAIRDDMGDILVFLPGAPEIHRLANLLADNLLPRHVDVIPLHGQLSPDEQDRAIAPSPHGRRKVVLATSIAETSLTIEGVQTVIDSGLARRPRFSPRTGMTRLETMRVSRAAADQRRGRAGRLGPGLCYRLWDERETDHLLAFAPPELLEADLVPLALDLAVMGIHDPLDLSWLDPPPAAAFAQARELLGQLLAIDSNGRVTAEGRAMAQLSMHPRLARMVRRATRDGDGAAACDIAALLGERDILRGAARTAGADLRARLDALHDTRPSHAAVPDEPPPVRGVLHGLRQQANRWRDQMGVPAIGARGAEHQREATGRLLSLAYPDRVARRRTGSTSRYVMRNGAGAVLPEGDALGVEEFLVVAESDGRVPESRIYLAAPLSLADVEREFAHQIADVAHVEWHVATGVRARRERRLGAIVLASHRDRAPDPIHVAHAVAGAARQHGLQLLPWTENAIRLRKRMRFLHHADASWPDVSDEALIDSLFDRLTPQLGAVRSADELRRLDVHAALLDLLAWEQRARLDLLAPTHFVAPSGSRLPVDYSDPAAPAVAVRLQEMFGCRDTPSVLAGRVQLTLKLLSPANRPMQVTRDLAGFWRTTYFDVRKDLRTRYPKHDWPDDPIAATPTNRAKRRR